MSNSHRQQLAKRNGLAEPFMLTVKQVAQLANISISYVYKAIADGSLQHHRFGKTIRITEDQFYEWLASSECQQVSTRPARKLKHLDL